MDPLHDRLHRTLQARKAKGRLRRLTSQETPFQSTTNSAVIELSSNDYLGLAASTELKEEFRNTIATQTTLASTGSRLLSGNLFLAERLERRACTFFNSAAALFCPSGYEANVAIFSCLPNEQDIVLHDALVHASVHTGLRASRCRSRRAFAHNDLHDFQSQLTKATREITGRPPGHDGIVIVAVESLYSMDGDLAPIHAMLELMQQINPDARMVIDEAHATGIYGPGGRGASYDIRYDLAHLVCARLHTLGKALAGTGAIIICTSTMRLYLLNYARGLIYSTFASTPTLAHAYASFALLASGRLSDRTNQLWRCIKYTSECLLRLPGTSAFIVPAELNGPIVPIRTEDTLALSKYLHRKGFRVMSVRYPTVPQGEERVRLCLRADLDLCVIDNLMQTLLEYADLSSNITSAKL
ncbi:hypothetical protein PYCC9005_002164 [Savitreella phatthalungensis]